MLKKSNAMTTGANGQVINKTLNNPTQVELLRHLEVTARLMSKAISTESGMELETTIIANTDLGIAHNVVRMMGGFYTGASYHWDGCTVPFIPIDTTVNVCGTALFKVDDDLSTDEFIIRAKNTHSKTDRYSWNYTNGNHFISLIESCGEYGYAKGRYVLLHASANEFKKMLYPSSNVWYKDDIKIIRDDETGRFLRYISGVPATTFYGIADCLKQFNKKRNEDFAELMLGNKLNEEVLAIQHYGMPDEHSVYIGCHYECKPYTLLTAPGRPVFIIDPSKDYFMGTPHGFGLGLENARIVYSPDGNHITIGSKTFLADGSQAINIGHDAIVRCSKQNDDLDEYVSKILNVCPGTIIGKLKQLASISKDGDMIW